MSYYSPYKPYLGSTMDRTRPIYDSYASRYPGYDRGRRNSGERWSEYIPVEQRYTDYIPETRVEYRPIEKSYTDYIEVQHETDYVPVPRLEKRVEYIPVDRYDEHVDYVPVQSSHVVKTPAAGLGSSYSQPGLYAPPPVAYDGYSRGGYPRGGYGQGYDYYGRSRAAGGGYGYRYL